MLPEAKLRSTVLTAPLSAHSTGYSPLNVCSADGTYSSQNQKQRKIKINFFKLHLQRNTPLLNLEAFKSSNICTLLIYPWIHLTPRCTEFESKLLTFFLNIIEENILFLVGSRSSLNLFWEICQTKNLSL